MIPITLSSQSGTSTTRTTDMVMRFDVMDHGSFANGVWHPGRGLQLLGFTGAAGAYCLVTLVQHRGDVLSISVTA